MAICTITLPSANADLCTFNLHFGRIDKFMMTRAEPTDALDDVSDPAEWTTRLSNTTALTGTGVAAPIRYFYVNGEWPLPERTEIEVSNGRTAFTDPVNTLTLAIDDTGATNATLLSTLQGTTQRMKVWLEADGQVWGGNDGYEMDVTFLGRVIPLAKTEKQTIQVQLKYEGTQGAPVASVLPI